MSRSRRKTPIFGITTARSEAFDKATWHRAFRRAENQRLQSGSDRESRHFHEFSSPWCMQKDGKHWWSDADLIDRLMRK
ncbi:hypothetical protein [Pseudomonas sp.]|uniref:hypothetical protein n=1 Tax=Pseudomonas sp. TaxID=306 RepID=UPI0025830F64|nr:hypothetical protein [Pseudomonas sp.]